MIVMMLLFAEVIKFGISIVHRDWCRNSSWNLFLTVRKKIAYAPSMPAKVPDKYYKRIKKDVERLDAVSVRESETIPYLINEVGIKKRNITYG